MVYWSKIGCWGDPEYERGSYNFPSPIACTGNRENLLPCLQGSPPWIKAMD